MVIVSAVTNLKEMIQVLLVSNLFYVPDQIAVCFDNLYFYFIKTAKKPVYGNIALSVYKIDYTLRCLKHIC